MADKRIVYVLKNQASPPIYYTGLTSTFTTGSTRITPADAATPRPAGPGTWMSA